MKPEDYFDFPDPNDIRLKGTRIGIETILYDYIHRSLSPESVAGQYPSLSLEPGVCHDYLLSVQQGICEQLYCPMDRTRQTDARETEPQPYAGNAEIEADQGRT